MDTRHLRTLRCVACCLGLWLAAAQPSTAALVATDTSFGAGTATLDTVSGREWLDLSISRPFSLNFILGELGPAGMFAGFQVAASADVVALIGNSGLLTVGPGPAAFDAFNDALALFDGVVEDVGGLGCALAVYGVVSGGGSNVVGFLNDRMSMGACDFTGSTAFNVVNFAGGLAWSPDDPIDLSDATPPFIRLSGVWLFRDAVVVPAPGTLVLALLALAILLAMPTRLRTAIPRRRFDDA